MNCPVCKTELKLAERNGIEIDYCPECRGVWLDKGELDKIIECSAWYSERNEPETTYNRQHHDNSYFDKHDGYYDEHYKYDKYGHRKKRNFFEDLFDF